ncbi:MFS transporter [Acidisphaera sp. L21]|uniref:MFS transporter n=1 Tax=Acidisphaera sp. L21 TaxID=1641851 RepID=UPI001C202191|nr:MFS transporter [Acidisphaera sp. L21]
MNAGDIGARLDRLPATRSVWRLVALLSFGGFFEFYDLFLTGYVAPGLVRDQILTSTTPGLFGTSGVAGFVAALFAGLFVGTLLFGFVADRFGRRTIFTMSLLWYAAASAIMAFQSDAFTLNLFRFIAGIGIGVELVTIDTYISELVPKALRGRAFAINQTIQFAVVPVVAFLAYLLVPTAPFGVSGWRFVVWIGSLSAVIVWFIRREVPESPRWLASHGQLAEADRVVSALEARVAAEHGQSLPPPGPAEIVIPRGSLAEAFRRPYLSRTVMLVIFNVFQTVGFYGFANWVPTLLIKQGITTTSSLLYTFIIALASPVGPLVAALVADKWERKWLIVAAAAVIAVFGLLFSQVTNPIELIVCGVMLTMASNIMSFSFHAYQAELYPTRIRAVAVGFVYSFSRISAVFSAFMIAFFLNEFGTLGVFTFIAGSMVMVMLAIATGPRVNNRPLEEISR